MTEQITEAASEYYTAEDAKAPGKTGLARLVETVSARAGGIHTEEAYEIIAAAIKSFSRLGIKPTAANIGEYFASLDERAADPHMRRSAVFAAPEYDGPAQTEAEDIDRAEAGPEKQEGIVKCKKRKCASSNTISTWKQTRAGDEPITWFHKCSDCGATWRENG